MNEIKTYDNIKPVLNEMRDYLIKNGLKHDFKCNYENIGSLFLNFWEYKIFISLPNKEQLENIFEIAEKIENIINNSESNLVYSGIYFYAENSIVEIKYCKWKDNEDNDNWYDYDHNFY